MSSERYETITVQFWRDRIAAALRDGIPDPVRTGVSRSSSEEQMIFDERSRSILANHIAPGSRVLDIGCGWGYLVPFLPEDTHYLGIDFVPEFICEAITSWWGRPHTDFMLADVLLPETLGQFANASRDAVLGRGIEGTLYLEPSSQRTLTFDAAVGRWIEATIGAAAGAEVWERVVTDLVRIAGKLLLFSPQHVAPKVWEMLDNRLVVTQDYRDA